MITMIINADQISVFISESKMTLGIFIDNSKNESSKYSWNDEDVQIFKNMIRKEQINCRMDDIFLLGFLRARKFDKERAIKLLKSYYSARERNKDIFKDFNPLAVKEYLDTKILGYTRQTDQKGRVIGFGRCHMWDPHKVHIKSVLKCTLMICDLNINEHVMQVNGLVLIFDANGLSWRHIIQLTPNTVYSIASLMFGSTQISYKEIHMVNVGKLLHIFLATFMPFLPHKIRQRIHLHSSGMESLHKFVDPKYLPVEYGGELPSLDPTECNDRLLEYQEFFEESEKYWNKSTVEVR
ncbi:alpha-tocopherol transfer protein-like isoform X1 [Centruroides vittatus]|uniref:alpha-tocopherol transfer protein-like isoform X1 n=1 Tax=Centruroides vittatus TaxID=120091 RepID=UPI00350FD3C1